MALRGLDGIDRSQHDPHHSVRTRPISARHLARVAADAGGVAGRAGRCRGAGYGARPRRHAVLGLIFVHEVFVELAMPTFDNTLLGLMGISAGTYLGLKTTSEKDK